MSKFTRKGILEDFKAKIARKEPIIASGAGAGIVASMGEQGGLDFIIVYHTGLTRLAAAPGPMAALPYGDANGIILDLVPKVIYRAPNTPVMGAMGIGEPFRDLDKMLDRLLYLGCAGIMHYPCPDALGPYLSELQEKYGIGTTAEAAHIKKLRDKDILTAAFAFDAEQSRIKAAAGLDILCAFVGGTAGGDSPINKGNTLSMPQAAENIQKMLEAAKKENPDIIVLCHGGPISEPEDLQACMQLCDVEGFIAGSSIERIPIEKAIYRVSDQYRGLHLNRKSR